MPRKKRIRPFAIFDTDSDALDVYRVEHRDTQIGPYNHVETRDKPDSVMRLIPDGYASKGTHQPTAQIDIPDAPIWLRRVSEERGVSELEMMLYGYPMRGIFFGFYNMASLRAWFGDSFLSLAQHGFVVAHYRVRRDGYVLGHNQVMFDRSKSIRVGTVPFTDIMQSVPLLPRAATLSAAA